MKRIRQVLVLKAAIYESVDQKTKMDVIVGGGSRSEWVFDCHELYEARIMSEAFAEYSASWGVQQLM